MPLSSIREITNQFFKLYEKSFMFINLSLGLAISTTIYVFLIFTTYNNLPLHEGLVMLSVLLGFGVLNYIAKRKVIERTNECYQILTLEKIVRRTALFSASFFFVGFFFFQIIILTGLYAKISLTIYSFQVFDIAGLIWLYSLCLAIGISVGEIRLTPIRKGQLSFRLALGISQVIDPAHRLTYPEIEWFIRWSKEAFNSVNKALWSAPRRPQLDVELILDNIWLALLFEKNSPSQKSRHQVYAGLLTLLRALLHNDIQRFFDETGRILSLSPVDFLKLRHSWAGNLSNAAKTHSHIISVVLTLMAILVAILSWVFPFK